MKPYFSTLSRLLHLNTVAQSWVGTPFFPNGYVKGPAGGVSCQTLVCCIYEELGVVPLGMRVPAGPMDWGHASKESLIEPMIEKLWGKFVEPVSDSPMAGDLIGFWVGGCVHHVGICLGEEFIHCLRGEGVKLNRIDDATYLIRLHRLWRPIDQ